MTTNDLQIEPIKPTKEKSLKDIIKEYDILNIRLDKILEQLHQKRKK